MTVRRGNCPASGKSCFTERKYAKKVAHDKHMQDVSVYKCDDCPYFHIGGWHGSKDRSQHRELHGQVSVALDMPIIHAARFLRVSEDIVYRMIDAGKIRGTDTHANTTDIHRIHTMILRTP